MSSLLSNDFNEEYFRLTKDLVTNEQVVYVDRNNRVVFTHPFFTEDIIRISTPAFSEQKIAPENVNIIFDSISFYTSNPRIENYLPLKISFGGKPQIEFSYAFFNPLKDFRVVRNPPLVNADVRNHRYGALTNHNINITGSIVALIEFDNQIYYTDSGTANTEVYYVDGSQPTSQLADVGQCQEYKSNTRHVVGLSLDRQSLYNVLNDRVIISLVGDLEIYDFQLKGDHLIYSYADTTDSDPAFLVWVNLGSSQEGDEEYKQINVFDEYGITVESFDIIDIDTIVFGFSDSINLIRFTDTTDSPILIGDLPSGVLGDVIGVFTSSTDDKSQPIGIAFIKDGNDIVIYRVDFDLLTRRFEKLKAEELRRIPFGNNPERPELIKYINQVAWIDGINPKVIQFYNLDTDQLVSYPFNIQNFKDFDFVANSYFKSFRQVGPPPVPPDRILNSISFNKFSILNAYSDGGIIYINRLENERNIDEVYKVSYNYDERAYPFDLTSRTDLSFTLALPNSGTTPDLEIFNYVIDYRIRYTKQSTNPNPSVPRITTKKEEKEEKAELRKNQRFRRQGPVVRDTEDILGLVDPDQFNVQDFLQIYNPN